MRIKQLRATYDVYLKGSCARGDFLPGISDIDLCIILKDETKDSDFVDFLTRVIELKSNWFFRYFDFLGEFEIHFNGDLALSGFAEYSKYFSWKSLLSERKVERSEMSYVDHVSWMIYKLLEIPKDSSKAIIESQKRRLENVTQLSLLEYSFDKTKAYDENRKILINKIDAYIKSHLQEVSISNTREAIEVRCPYNGKEVIFEELNLTEDIRHFLLNHWGVNSDYYKKMNSIFFYYQWKSYLCNTFRRQLDHAENKDALLRFFFVRYKNDPIKNKSLMVLKFGNQPLSQILNPLRQIVGDEIGRS